MINATSLICGGIGNKYRGFLRRQLKLLVIVVSTMIAIIGYTYSREPIYLQDVFLKIIVTNRLPVVLEAVCSIGIDVNRRLFEQSPMISFAANKGDYRSAEILLKYGANVNGQSVDNPLMCAVLNGDTEMVALLLAHGADVDYQEPVTKATALMYAAKSGDVEIVKILLAYQANVNIVDFRGKSALYYAAQANAINDVQTIRQMIDNVQVSLGK